MHILLIEFLGSSFYCSYDTKYQVCTHNLCRWESFWVYYSSAHLFPSSWCYPNCRVKKIFGVGNARLNTRRESLLDSVELLTCTTQEGRHLQRVALTYVNNSTEYWRGICGGAIPSFFSKLVLTLANSKLCSSS